MSEKVSCNSAGSAGSGAVYGLGFLGALYFYLTTATSFGMGALGVVKAIFWPGVLVYEVLTFLAQ